MKIVIDIPDAIMEYVRNNGCLSVIYDDEVAKAIINGTPYEDRPQGDLISRAWLKKHKFTTQVCNGLEIEDVDVVGVAIIDNAPTVVAENATSDRPQGKWYEYIDKGLLKARHGDYALYKVDFLLDNLAREVNIMESARQMTCGADMRVKSELKDELNELKEAENDTE